VRASIATPEKMKPSMYVDGDDAKALAGHAPGTRVATTGTGTIVSVSRSKHGGKLHHSATIEFDKLRHSPAGKKAVRGRIAAIRSGKR
jgi:hypothetical protein